MTVHHITSGRSDKNIGKAVNDIVKNIDPDDWICLRDIDTMPMHHRVFFKQCEDIAESGEFDLVSCITNRISVSYQLHDGVKSENYNILDHLKIAEDRYEDHGNYVKPCDYTVSGVMMLFSKRTWEKVGGFRDGRIKVNGRFFDFDFSQRVERIGGKLGIAQGIYLFHLYRPWVVESRTKNVRMQYQHLL